MRYLFALLSFCRSLLHLVWKYSMYTVC